MGFQYALSKFIPVRDEKACARVRAIRRADIAKHPRKDFRIDVIDDKVQFYSRFALDIVDRIRKAGEAGKRCVLILPVGPVPQYSIAAQMINRLRISCQHLVTFNMDEYANDQGETAPADWEGSFATSMRQSFFSKIDPKLRPAEKNIHFPTHRNIESYWKMIEDAGGADCCYGGIGWCGHIAFWESHLGLEFGDDLSAYKKAHGRIVELNPMTIMQNALHTFSSDWSWVPPRAASIGPREILGARDRSFWLDGDCGTGGMSWQRFIARLVAHGPVNTCVPGSILQETNCGYHILGSVAEDVKIDFS
jgi:glucosamine-6-phosphate deaminase